MMIVRIWAVWLVVVACGYQWAGAQGKADAKPNFVIFISDDHGQLDSQPYGAADVRTPNMAKLAARGIRFTHAFCASPACGPSRATLLTGLWPARTGAEANHTHKRDNVAALPPRLRELGYEVAAFGKVAHGRFAPDYGFDVAEKPYVGITDLASVTAFLEKRDRSKPLCLFVGTRHPHVPWSKNEGYMPNKLTVPPTHVDTPVTRSMRAQYYTDVTKSDQLLGELMTLVEQKLSSNTLIAYTADHGAQWPAGKWNLYDAGIRVPLLIAWPGHLPEGSASSAMVCLPDLLPTLIELGGGQVPAGLDGQSFAAVLRGQTASHRSRVFTTHSGDGDFNVYPIRSVRTNQWKYIRNLHPEFQHHSHISRSTGPSGLVYWQTWLEAAKSDPQAAAKVQRIVQRPAEELYDLAQDPFELHNLATEPTHAERMQTMRAELDEWLRSQGDTLQVFGKPLPIGAPVELITPGQKPAATK